MNIDHIFIFSNTGGDEADQLVKLGFSEGSSRVHPGQGTTNLKFYFENFFLEVLWAHNPDELHSPVTSRSELWKRAAFETNHFSRFGLCLVNETASDSLFEGSLNYEPAYFPGKNLEIITNHNAPHLPYTFRLPFVGAMSWPNEPLHHANGIRILTKASFECPVACSNVFTHAFAMDGQVNFVEGNRSWLHLTFDHASQGQTAVIEQLQLTISY